jgi:hypothetical protein
LELNCEEPKRDLDSHLSEASIPSSTKKSIINVSPGTQAYLTTDQMNRNKIIRYDREKELEKHE